MADKPKKNQPSTPDFQQTRDLFQTPDYATDLIVPHLFPNWIIWESCCGQGKITKRLEYHGHKVIGTDICLNPMYDCLEYSPQEYSYECIVTNPPFSLKAKIVERFIKEINCPFALLIPGDWSRWLINAIDKFDCQLLVPSRRINYITPNGKQGKESSSQFHSVWLTRYLNLGNRVVFAELTQESMKNI